MQIIKKYFPDLSQYQIKQFEQLQNLYGEWNSKINVISRKDIENLYEKHILHSLGIAKVIKFKKGTKILDVGTGGGFPGIPLAIIFPDSKFTLIDSIGKKIKVVNAIADELKLSNVKAMQIRAENINDKFDFIVSRAVTSLPVFYHWVNKKIIKKSFNDIDNGILYLKGGDIDKELIGLKKQYSVYALNKYFTEDFFSTKKIIYIKNTSTGKN
ncbi:MAG: 16S rRNA (guanine(527)-N(7))-methyltransferase RsmG [Bacteroidales bacterium]|nr:16S rRNA (guanine(527)-N(7))-methyltransferase RsmG [Bacteroidales bacterium]